MKEALKFLRLVFIFVRIPEVPEAFLYVRSHTIGRYVFLVALFGFEVVFNEPGLSFLLRVFQVHTHMGP